MRIRRTIRIIGGRWKRARLREVKQIHHAMMFNFGDGAFLGGRLRGGRRRDGGGKVIRGQRANRLVSEKARESTQI